ncbi:hypothetical protein [Anseongella ginsenosidimutans]|nr:hypothetical protein [Anseongella ginsenosidimutans]QEC53607.1 hypothetical protein FRZ59_15540 [Anseongella ginsenosidimutans]
MEKDLLNDPDLFWKNFRLGTELQISDSFIYNSIFVLENMESLYYEHECFEFLYHISVGVERLQKIALILIEHDGTASVEDFEKSLITHSHLELWRRIKEKREVKTSKQLNRFLALLDKFYKSTRYDRYNLSSVYRPPQDKGQLTEFISEELGIKIQNEAFFPTPNSDRIKNLFARVIGKLVDQLYQIVRQEAGRLNIYTYEIAHNSKAYKIFIAKEFTFEKEKLMQREVCAFLLKSEFSGEFGEYINSLEPLEFEQLGSNKYFESIFNIHKDRDAIDEMIYLYEETETEPERVQQFMALGSDINFDELDDYED